VFCAVSEPYRWPRGHRRPLIGWCLCVWLLQVFGTTMWGTREPPDWLARRWNRRHNNKNKGKGQGGEGSEEGEGEGEGEGDAGRSGEAEGDVEAGEGVQRRANNSSWAGPSIRLPPLPKLHLPEVSQPPSAAVSVSPPWGGLALVCNG
jgi:hypothetical protein